MKKEKVYGNKKNRVDALVEEIETLSTEEKVQVLQKPQRKSLPERKEPSHDDLDKIFGGFKSSKSAEEIIKEIYDSRTLGREIESLD